MTSNTRPKDDSSSVSRPSSRANLVYRYSMPADQRLSRIREFLHALRHIWNSWNTEQPLTFRGKHYKHVLNSPFFTPPPCPHGPPRIFLTATGPRMAELAGELADGLIAPPYTPPLLFTEVLLPALKTGLKKAGTAACRHPGGVPAPARDRP